MPGCSRSAMLAKDAGLPGPVRATAELRIERTKDLLLCAQVVITPANVVQVISSCCFAEDGTELC